MPGADGGAGVTKRPQTVGRGRLGVEVVSEDRETEVVEARGVVADVTADHEPLADPDRLVTGSVARGREQLDRAVPEQVVIAVDHDHPVADAGVVGR